MTCLPVFVFGFSPALGRFVQSLSHRTSSMTAPFPKGSLFDVLRGKERFGGRVSTSSVTALIGGDTFPSRGRLFAAGGRARQAPALRVGFASRKITAIRRLSGRRGRRPLQRKRDLVERFPPHPSPPLNRRRHLPLKGKAFGASDTSVKPPPYGWDLLCG